MPSFHRSGTRPIRGQQPAGLPEELTDQEEGQGIPSTKVHMALQAPRAGHAWESFPSSQGREEANSDLAFNKKKSMAKKQNGNIFYFLSILKRKETHLLNMCQGVRGQVFPKGAAATLYPSPVMARILLQCHWE